MTDPSPPATEAAAERALLIREMAEQDRPRERLLRLGPEALKDEELLAIVIRIGRPGRSALDMARELLHRYQYNLALLAAAAPADLAKTSGIGMAKAAELKATFAIATRMAAQQLPEKTKLTTPDAAARFLREVFRGKKQEEVHVLVLDTKNRFVCAAQVTRGLLDQSALHAREVFRPAIEHGGAKLMLAHNHPSGDPTPSPQDVACTKALAEAGKLLGIELVDHLVIGLPTAGQLRDYFSFREHGMM
jgi:DNA repair protein RadC